MPRSLEPAPHQLLEASKPVFGSFRGALPQLDLGATGRSKLWDFLHEKRWIYAGVADDAIYAGVAIVSLGYVSTAIVFVNDRRTGRMLFDRSLMAPPTSVRFTDQGAGARSATFRFGGARIEVSDTAVSIDVSGAQPLHVDVRRTGREATPIGAVVPIEGGYASATEKRVADAHGEVVAEGKRFVLDRAVLAHDHTHGFLARRTAWRWALGLGRTSDGERLAFNLVEGFVGEPECGAWVGDQLFPLGEGRFEFTNPRMPWKIKTTCGALDLTFHPSAVHSEETNLLVVSSRFIQPVGAFDGALVVDGRTVPIKNVAGVTEHQDVLW